MPHHIDFDIFRALLLLGILRFCVRYYGWRTGLLARRSLLFGLLSLFFAALLGFAERARELEALQIRLCASINDPSCVLNLCKSLVQASPMPILIKLHALLLVRNHHDPVPQQLDLSLQVLVFLNCSGQVRLHRLNYSVSWCR